jgi:hypothetical protein
MCIKATEHFYKKYMETIVMKVLQDRIAPGEIGYQEIRQRSAGHYDMQVPTFDKDEFSFLHDLNAPWMPFVRKFLSNSTVALIHKGIFYQLIKVQNRIITVMEFTWTAQNTSLAMQVMCFSILLTSL